MSDEIPWAELRILPRKHLRRQVRRQLTENSSLILASPQTLRWERWLNCDTRPGVILGPLGIQEHIRLWGRGVGAAWTLAKQTCGNKECEHWTRDGHISWSLTCIHDLWSTIESVDYNNQKWASLLPQSGQSAQKSDDTLAQYTFYWKRLHPKYYILTLYSELSF